MSLILIIDKAKTHILALIIALVFGCTARFVPDYLTSHFILANLNHLQILQSAIAWFIFTNTVSLSFKLKNSLHLWKIILFTIIYVTIAATIYDLAGYITGDYKYFTLKRYLIDRGVGGLVLIIFTSFFCGTISFFLLNG